MNVVQFPDHPVQPLIRHVKTQKRKLVQFLAGQVLENGSVQRSESAVETRVPAAEGVQRIEG
ncbi:hypothetical protein AB0F81_39965 [Actinoplanes sp. NPDC024001]|uniref:hypothetical protein n=1 Tax=Actinoplanes sp. NPDC024001 TaxID=3154598 RepID=UPI0033D4A873